MTHNPGGTIMTVATEAIPTETRTPGIEGAMILAAFANAFAGSAEGFPFPERCDISRDMAKLGDALVPSWGSDPIQLTHARRVSFEVTAEEMAGLRTGVIPAEVGTKAEALFQYLADQMKLHDELVVRVPKLADAIQVAEIEPTTGLPVTMAVIPPNPPSCYMFGLLFGVR